MAAVTVLRRDTGKSHSTSVLESDTILVGGLELSAAGAATLYTDANTTSITIGASGSNVIVDSASVRGTDDGTGLILGHASAGASTGSAPQLISMTTTQRDDLVGANGMAIYNTTTASAQVRNSGSWVDFPGAGGGDVSGPGASTDNAIVRWDGTAGTAVLDSAITISDLASSSTTMAGAAETGTFTIQGVDATTTATAGAGLDLLGGDGLTTGDGGDANLDGGASPSGTAGSVTIGGTNASVVTIGRSGIDIVVNADSVQGVDDGTGLILGHAGSGASSGSAPQLVSLTTTERDDLVEADGMIVYNETLDVSQVRNNGAWYMFGLYIGSGEETTASQTTSTAFSQFLRYTTPSVAAGDYLIEWFYVWSHNDTSSDFIGRVQVDDTTDLIDPSDTGVHREESQDSGGTGTGGTNQRHVVAGRRVVTLTAATHNIDIDFTTSSGGVTSTMYHAVITVWRVA